MQQLVCVYTAARRIRSAESNALVVSRTRSRPGDYTFVHTAAPVWEALSLNVTSKTSLDTFKYVLMTHTFKYVMKMHLFTIASA